MSNQIVPADYEQLLRELKNRIRSAQIKAALAVNRGLVHAMLEVKDEKPLSLQEALAEMERA